MMDTQLTSEPAMSIEICLNQGGSQNPMDLASVLNPQPAPSSSHGGSERYMVDDRSHESPNVFHSGYSAPQPMEVDGEHAAWVYHERDIPILPPMLLADDPRRLHDLAHRPAQGLRMAQISRRSENSAARRQSCPTPRSPPRRHDRHGLLPRLSIASSRSVRSMSPSVRSESSLDGTERTIGKKKKRKPSGPHNNKPYTQEQFHWLWYHCEDRDFKYAEMYSAWRIQFPHERRDPGQAFSSRLYREPLYPVIDANGKLVRDRDGKPKIKPLGRRQRQLSDFKDLPFKLWEHSPDWALYWDWVLPEHKVMARRIIDGQNLDNSQLRKEKYRRAIRLYAAEAPMKKGWFATPALHAAAVQKAKANNETTRFSTSPSPEQEAVINLESRQTPYWGREYDIDSNGRKFKL